MATDLDWLGLDVGGTHLKGARVSSEGRTRERIHEPIASGSAEALLAQIAAAAWGCVETVAGARGWRRRAEQWLASRPSALRGSELDPKTILAAAQAGDALALEIVDGAAAALGVGLAAALDLLNLDRVVVGGGVAAAGSFLLDRIVEQTRRRTFPQVFAGCSFRAAELGNDAGLLGAARAAMLAGG